MFFNLFGNKKKVEQEKRELELEKKIQRVKDVGLKQAKNVTLTTKRVNTILYEKTDDIILNIYLATGGDRR